MRAVAQFLLAACLACLPAGLATAQDLAYVHVVRNGETLASIAQSYYGDPKRENVLVAENGLLAQGGAAIVEGLRLIIPTVSYHRVQAGDTWKDLAQRYYGDPSRAVALLRANQAKPGSTPDEGAQLLIPYPVRHIIEQGESLLVVAEQYYKDRNDLRILKAFNASKAPLKRGHVILVPLFDLVLSEEGRARLSASGQKIEGGETRAAQSKVDEQLPLLHEHVVKGRFVEAVALGNQLLGSGQLTGHQEISIQRELATAYVALGRNDLAVVAFGKALQKQPDLELDSARTSPRVLKALEDAKSARQAH
ncbi:MAG: LysM domain-containing protein [Myxococcales bacterium]